MKKYASTLLKPLGHFVKLVKGRIGPVQTSVDTNNSNWGIITVHHYCEIFYLFLFIFVRTIGTWLPVTAVSVSSLAIRLEYLKC